MTSAGNRSHQIQTSFFSVIILLMYISLCWILIFYWIYNDSHDWWKLCPGTGRKFGKPTHRISKIPPRATVMEDAFHRYTFRECCSCECHIEAGQLLGRWWLVYTLIVAYVVWFYTAFASDSMLMMKHHFWGLSHLKFLYSWQQTPRIQLYSWTSHVIRDVTGMHW